MRQKGNVIGLSFAALIAFGSLVVSSPASAQLGDCVSTVRSISDFTIRGDAWTWWDHAAGQYDRENSPAVGSVLVFKRTGHMRRGHVSLVSAVIDRRTIEVDHSWIYGNGLRRGMRVVDVSRNNDWSSVRVWHEPTDQLGMRVYAAYGFIMPEGEEDDQPSRGRALDAGDRGMDRGFSSAPRGRGASGGPRIVEASLHPQKALSVTIPGRKPQTLSTAVASLAPQKPARLDTAVLPPRKPGGAANSTQALSTEVAALPVAHAPTPGRKPGSGPIAQMAERH